MPTPLTGRENLHTLAVYGNPLGVECRGCGRRALVEAEKLDAFKGNMKELRTLKFICSACGSRDWAGWLFVTREEADAFMGNTVGGPTFF